MKISVQSFGLKALKLRFANKTAIYLGMKSRMEEAVEVLEEEVREQLRKGPKDIPKGGKRVELIALPKNPTEHLRIRSSRLIGSITGRVTRQGTSQVIGRVGPQRVVYAAIHEFGGKAGNATIPARPYLAPALDNKRDELERILGRALNVFKGGLPT